MSTNREIKEGSYSAQLVKDNRGIPPHDYIGYTNDVGGRPTTIVYRRGGPSGTIVCTITNVYDGSGFLTSTQIVYA
jgi:hypothetical protein